MRYETYLQTGKTLLPGISNIEDFFEGCCVKPTPLCAQFKEAPIADGAILPDAQLKQFGLSRTVKKTSERQARWVIQAAIETFQKTNINVKPNQIGLFLGLGTVDCDDDDLPVMYDGDAKKYINKLLFETKPLMALTLLNSTTASHISQILNITGVNSVFSPSTDSGAQAVCESHYNLLEDRCEYSLIAAGSQKLSPWYYLANKNLIESWGVGHFPSESASAIIASKNYVKGAVRLMGVLRTFTHNQSRPLPNIERLIPKLMINDQLAQTQIIVTGKFKLSSQECQKLKTLLPKQPLCLMDNLTGYTGAPGALHAINLGIATMKRQESIRCSSQMGSIEIKNCNFSTKRVLIIALGPSGQHCYLVLSQ